ncbi:MAG: hypothetical protein IPL61_18085 [Myxococcales bacterium]|nr:hypothetical protein [Myxococcales bacterium]
MRGLALIVVTACAGKAAAPQPPPPAVPAPAPTTPAAPALRAPRHVTPADGQPPSDPWPAASFTLADELATAIGTGDAIGTTDRVIRSIADPQGRWAIVCQQRRDTDHDGVIRFQQEAHFALGDRPAAYLVIGGGPGLELETVNAISPTGDHAVVGIDRAVVLLDLARRTGAVLPGAHGDAGFSPDGTQLVYRVDADATHRRAIRRTLATGAEVAHDLPAAGWLGGVVPFEARWTVVPIAEEADPAEWMRPYDAWCALGSRDHSLFPPVRFLWVDFDTQTIVEDPALVRPVGAHRLTRRKHGLALDGQPIGAARCKELDMIGVHPPSGMVITQCYDDPQQIYVNAPNVKPFTISGVVERTFEPIAKTLPGPSYCTPSGECIDLTTGAPTAASASPPAARLVRDAADGAGPLRWAEPDAPPP